ncbi:MAG: short chain dehydrogenase, partial [Methylocystis sp.]
ILTRPSRSCTGNFFIDVEVLREEGVKDFKAYAVDPSLSAVLDFFLDEPLSEGVVKADFHPGG